MRKFKTESKKLLDLMINSIYTNREIFLRELISNASDAVDKLYFKSLTDSDIKLDKSDLRILVSFDKEARTITVSDNGIGMTEEDLDKNLGTIAHSGSFEFKDENAEQQGEEIDIIGQFGVGFYSSFMVAESVKVISRAYGFDKAYCWESDGVKGYAISEAERDSHGTDVILTLRPNTEEDNYDEFLSEYGLKNLIKRYSNYLRYPIQMEVSKRRELPKPEDAGDDYKPEFEDYTEIETINSMIPIWKRAKSDVSQEEYNTFYKTDFHDFTDPSRTITVHAEGTLSYDALLFIPSRAPFDFYSKDYKKGLALYSSNVLIMEKCEDLLPDYFNFVRGIVDSQDLSLNISRETLQQNSQLRAIERRLEKKIKADLVDFRDNNREGYESFFKEFGQALKFGIYTSYGQNQELLGDLLLFYSAKEEKFVTLDEYTASAHVDQESIFYATGESTERLAKSPIVKSVLAKGYDVLLCTQEVDEFCITSMPAYNEKSFKNVAGGDLGLETEEEKSKAEEVSKENEKLLNAMLTALGGKVTKVAVSTRLTDAPSALTAEGPISLEMEKILNQMPNASEEAIKSERVLELNADHPVFAALKAAEAANDTEKIDLYADILYNQALMVEGMPIEDPVAYAQAISKLMI
ncbi:MAG: molecular chaperone HtpG [Raoultibacter sp.]|jgi:molecular chaperone HtpG